MSFLTCEKCAINKIEKEKEIDKLGFLDYLKIFVTNNISNMEKGV